MNTYMGYKSVHGRLLYVILYNKNRTNKGITYSSQNYFSAQSYNAMHIIYYFYIVNQAVTEKCISRLNHFVFFAHYFAHKSLTTS